MTRSPYQVPGFYDEAIAAGRHRAIVGGRWDETGRAQMAALLEAGLLPHHHLLDIGAGALRLGCKAVPYLDPGHYWATDASREILLAGYREEMAQPARLDPGHLVQDADFTFPGVPDDITHAIAFAVFPHLPPETLGIALASLRRFPNLERFLFTVFLAEPGTEDEPVRQPDGVVTHRTRAPFHVLETEICAESWRIERQPRMLPRGQVLFTAQPSSVT